MTRNLKTLGPVLVAAFALSALTATSASATTHTFKSDGIKTHLTAEAKSQQVIELKTNDSKQLKCGKVSFQGTTEGKEVSSITVTPTYTECGIYLESGEKFADFFFHMNGCHYVFRGETTESTTPGEHATFEIECDKEGGAIETRVTALTLKCIAIPPQKVHGVRYTNAGASPTDITFDITVHGLKSTTISSPFCSGPETHTTGTYTGEVTVKGYSDAEHKNPTSISVSPGA
jgi:hypothetical protein